MNYALDPDFTAPAATRGAVAAALASYYSELAGTAPEAPPFSIARHLLSIASGRGPTGREAEVLRAAATTLGQSFDACRAWVPLPALSTRTMTTATGGKGGYLVQSDVLDAADVLRPWSVAAESGCRVLTGLTGTTILPRVTSATAGSWISETSSAPAESPPTVGNVSLTPRTGVAFIKFSMGLLRQGEQVEALIRQQLLGAIGELIDTAFFAGTGQEQPLGLLSTTGIGTQSGTDLAHAGVLAMAKSVLAAGGRADRQRWVAPPATAELLSARERVANGGRHLWDDGTVLGRPAHATKTAPASTLVCGDFSQAVIGIFGPGVRIDVDPSQDFAAAGLVARVMLMCDIGFPRPDAFCVATSVT